MRVQVCVYVCISNRRWQQYLQCSQYQLPGGAQHGPVAVGQVQQGSHALDVLSSQLVEGHTVTLHFYITEIIIMYEKAGGFHRVRAKRREEDIYLRSHCVLTTTVPWG